MVFFEILPKFTVSIPPLSEFINIMNIISTRIYITSKKYHVTINLAYLSKSFLYFPNTTNNAFFLMIHIFQSFLYHWLSSPLISDLPKIIIVNNIHQKVNVKIKVFYCNIFSEAFFAKFSFHLDFFLIWMLTYPKTFRTPKMVTDIPSCIYKRISATHFITSHYFLVN